MRLSEVIREVIRLAQARREYWDAELPKRHPDYPVIHPGEDSGPPPPEEIQLREFLTSLPGDKVYELLLIMYLGRGDFGTRDLAARFDELKDTFDKPEQAVAQMMSKSPLADYLAEGLANLKKQKIDVDHLLPKPARPRK